MAAAPAFRAVASVGGGTSATATFTLSGAKPGDLLICRILMASITATLTPPSPPSDGYGWTQISTISNGGVGVEEFAYSHVLTQSEFDAGTTVWSFGISTSLTWQTMGAAYGPGVNVAKPIDAIAAQDIAPTTTPAVTGITASRDKSTIVVMLTAFSPAGAQTPPGGMTERLDDGTAEYIDDVTQATAGATGTETATVAVAAEFFSLIMALNPLDEVGPVPRMDPAFGFHAMGIIPLLAAAYVQNNDFTVASGPHNYTQGLTAALSFVGGISKADVKALAAASLSFTGALQNRTGKAVGGALSFVGTMQLTTKKALTAAVSFAGSLPRAIQHLLAASLGFMGNLAKATARALVAGSLSFIGAIQRSRAVALAAALSFTGSIQRSTGKGLTAGLSFAGSISRAIKHSLTAALSFTGNLAKSVNRALSGALSFTGLLTSSRVVLVALAAALSFVGSIAKRTSKPMAASVGFAGSIFKTSQKALSAALSFAGTLLKRSAKAITASLSFAGNLARSMTRALSAALSFVGATMKRPAKTFAGSIGFTGTLSKQAGKALSASLSFLGSLAKAIRKGLSSALSFLGNLALSSSAIVIAAPFVRTAFVAAVSLVAKVFPIVAAYVAARASTAQVPYDRTAYVPPREEE